MNTSTKEGYQTYLVYELVLPLSVMLGKTKFILNLNRYRNSHYRVLSDAKNKYSEAVTTIVGNLPPKLHDGLYWMSYTLFPKTAARTDVANPLSVIDKFTQDALVKNGVFLDDNYKIIKGVSYEFGAIDRINPRAELRVYELCSG